MLIFPHAFDELEIFQINPSPAAAESVVSLHDMHGDVVTSGHGRIAAHGARRIVWSTQPLRSYPFVSLASDTLTAPNAKPLVFLNFANGAFTAAHS
jgi:hypothetical protein